MFRKGLSSLILLAFLFNLLAADISIVYSQDKKKMPRIAVLTFADTNASAKREQYGEAISGMLMTELINGKVFQVIERSEIERIMNEMRFQISGAVDASTAKQLGVLLGVDILVFGSVAKFDPLVETDIRLIDTQSGQALLAENASSRSGMELRSMVQTLARKIEQRYLGRLIGEVKINSSPANATVYIDGIMEGKTPVTKNLSNGPHKIRVALQNYDIWEKTIVVSKERDAVNVNLQISKEYLARTKQKYQQDNNLDKKQQKSTVSKSKGKSEKGGSNALLWVIGGVVLVGGAVAALLLLGGDDEKNNDSSVTITVDIP